MAMMLVEVVGAGTVVVVGTKTGGVTT